MRKFITLLCSVLLILMNVTFIYGDESYTLTSNTSDDGSHYYLPSEIPLPDNVKVVGEEKISENYLTDYDGNTWNMYSVTLETEGDGTDAEFKELENELNSNSYTSQAYSTLGYTSGVTYAVDGKEYSPYVDMLVIGTGEDIDVKSINGQSYAEGEQSGNTIIVQYTLNRYSDESEMEAISDKLDQSTEQAMRKGTIQISLFYPSGTSIEDYYDDVTEKEIEVKDNTPVVASATDSITNDNKETADIEEKIEENIGALIGYNYTSETKDNSTVVKDENGKEVLEISKETLNEIKVEVKDNTLEDDEVYELLCDLASSLVSDNSEDTSISVEDDVFTVSNSDNTEVIEIAKNDDGNFTLTVKETKKYDLTQSEDTDNKVSDTDKDIDYGFMFWVLLFVVVFVLVILIVTIIVINKKKHNGNKHNK